MNPLDTYNAITDVLRVTAMIGYPLQVVLAAAAAVLAVFALLPAARDWRDRMLTAMAVLLVAGEGVLLWLHWRLYQLAVVVDPATGLVTGHVTAPLWIESEKLYAWALLTCLMGVFMRRHRSELLSGVMLIVALLTAGAALLGQPFTSPLPGFIGQYSGYLQAMAQGGQIAAQGLDGMEGARQGYYNAWYMWVHPPLLFLSYGAFSVSFVATWEMIRARHSAFETTAYRWAQLGYLPLTLGMLLGLPWALMSWQGEAWWWSGKVNMSIMMWMLYTAYLHARLYLRRQGMWKAVAILAVMSFVILVLTYIATYVVPGAHSYAAGATPLAVAATRLASAGAASCRGGVA